MHVRSRLVLASVTLAVSLHSPLQAQLPRPYSPPLRPTRSPASLLNDDDRSGPRVGIAYIVGGSVTAENMDRKFTPLTTFFGWQIEHQFDTGVKNAPVPMTELVMLAGGLEQGLFLPSVSWMLGLRQPNGWEAGVGPTLTGAGVQVAFAAGVT